MDTKQIHWYGQSAFRIEDDSKQIYIDPYKIPSGLPQADIIFVTHPHFDHFSMEDISKIYKKGHTLIIAPAEVASKFEAPAMTVFPGKPVPPVGKLKIQAVPAYNIDKKFHPKAKNWVGYIITLSDGRRIYHAGDLDFIPEMKKIETDIAMLPCGGTYTMTAEQAADAANSFMPKILIPMHYGEGLGTVEAGRIVKKLYKGNTEILKIDQ